MSKNKLSKDELKALINELSGHDVQENLQSVVDTENLVKSENLKFINYKEHLISGTNFNRRQAKNIKKYSQKLKLAIVTSLPIILLQLNIKQQWSFDLIDNQYQQIILMIFSSILMFYCAFPIFKTSFDEIKIKQPSSMTLVSLSLVLLYVFNGYASYLSLSNKHSSVGLFYQFAIIIVVSLLTELLRVKQNNKIFISELNKEHLPNKLLKKDVKQGLIEVNSQDIKNNDTVKIAPNEIIPVDGVVTVGETTIDESIITTDNLQVIKRIGDTVLAGSTNKSGVIEIKVTRPQNASYFYELQYQLFRAKQAIVDNNSKLTNSLFYGILVIGLFSFAITMWRFNIEKAISIMVAILLLGSPQLLKDIKQNIKYQVLNETFRHGILITNSRILNQLGKIRYAFFDKTGILTEGKFKIRSIKAVNDDYSDNDILAIMASLEQSSKHPLAQTILKRAKSLNINLMYATEVEEIPGIGIAGVINNERFALVSIDYLREYRFEFNQKYFEQLTAAGNTVSYLVNKTKVIGVVAQGDDVKATAVKLIKGLKQLKILPILLTSDNEIKGKSIATTLHIENVMAHLKPKDKLKIIKKYQNTGKVLMISDSLNDQATFDQVDISIVTADNLQFEIPKVDACLLKNEPSDILYIFKLWFKALTMQKVAYFWIISYHILTTIVVVGLSFILSPNAILGPILILIITILLGFNAINLRVKK